MDQQPHYYPAAQASDLGSWFLVGAQVEDGFET
jgi:hypothetical protein